MNVLITAGGTSEPIDSVRSITNTGTGRLGSLIADAFADRDSANHIYFVCAQNAVRPTSGRIQTIPIQCTQDLQNAVEGLLKRKKINAVIHSMAVSDYRVKAVLSTTSLAEALQRKLHTAKEATISEEMILQAILQTAKIESGKKLSSQVEHPLLLLEQTPKILPQFRQLAPDAVIVGFKLLCNVPKTELLQTANRLLVNNGCDFVLANDSVQIGESQHVAFLVDHTGLLETYSTKQEIAAGIVNAVLGKEPHTK